jgi:hypothetical protein
MRFFFVIILVFSLLLQPVSAQLGLGLTVTLDDESVEDGWYEITLRFYATPSSQDILAQEQLQGRFHGGYCHVTAGRSIEIPVSFLRCPTASIGFAINGFPERQPRIIVARHQFSEVATNALIAQSLDPGFTGFVTSINELAGPITLLGRDGIIIERDRTQLLLRHRPSTLVRGVVTGNDTTHQFTIAPGVQLTDQHKVRAYVTNSTTHIAVSADISVPDGTIVLTATAPLLASERIVWELYEQL